MEDTARVKALEKEVFQLKMATHSLIKYIHDLQNDVAALNKTEEDDCLDEQYLKEANLSKMELDLGLDSRNLKAYEQRTGIELPDFLQDYVHESL